MRKSPPPIPPRRTRAETVPYPDDLRIELRAACMGCKRCGADKRSWQVYCGAACCVADEAGV